MPLARSLLLAAILVSGCAHAAYMRAAEAHVRLGNQDAAVEYAALALKTKPGYEKAEHLMRDVLPATAAAHMDRGQALAGQGRWDEALAEFDRHADLATLARTTPGHWEIADSSKARGEVVAQAASAFYAEGVREMDAGRSREAARALRRCTALVPAFKDARGLYTECLEAAVRTVAVRGLSADPRWQQEAAGVASRAIAGFGELRLEFLRFVDEKDLDRMLAQQSLSQSGLADAAKAIEAGRLVGIAVFVDFHLDRATSEDSGWNEEKEDRAKEVPVYATKTVNGKEQQYVTGTKTVSATLVTRSRRTAASLTVHYEMTDVATGVTTQGTFSKDLEDATRYTTYSGDKNALDIADLMKIGGKRGDPSSPSTLMGQLIETAAEDMARQIAPAFR